MCGLLYAELKECKKVRLYFSFAFCRLTKNIDNAKISIISAVLSYMILKKDFFMLFFGIEWL